ncbi:hypothetical protein [Sphaerisporangium rhizosphaerae]|uniref:DUF1876 domain-containing protein n=1 Tax=Sphaerisporangium rhizosphaerae TaxID=2269375 RepID=A0ABW2P508_9ACTN
MSDNQREPYTHLRASIDDGTTRLDLSFYTPELAVTVFCVDQQRACLDISSREGQVSISSTGGGSVTEADIGLARELAHAAARYLSECERLYARRHMDLGFTRAEA